MAAGLPENDPKRGFSFGNAAAVTPSDSADLTYPAECLYVGGAGVVTLDTAGGQTSVPFTVPAGQYLWVHAKRVRSTGTTATLIVALW